MGHVTASYFLADYYRREKDSSSKNYPSTQASYDAAIFYYDRAATQIEKASHYPKGVYGDVSEVEAKRYMSVRAYTHLTGLYYYGYGRALEDMLKNDVSYTDTIKVLNNMLRSAERCLERPSLSVWGARQNEISNSKQVICQAQKDFAKKALDLESQRIEIAKRCDVTLSECTEHQGIFQEIVQVVQEMNNKTSSVPKI